MTFWEIIRRGRQRGHVAFFGGTLALAGCAGAPPAPPSTPLPTGWTYDDHPGRIITTPHYRIFTTIADAQTTSELATLMELALVQYQKVAPAAPLSAEPMPCYFFAQRDEWADYTRHHTGVFAPLYLKINRGGYTINDTFVAFMIGNSGTFAVAAHEGFHQYVARNFKTRPPPFLEEGIASLFENVRWTGETPHWDLSITPARAARLRHASEAHELWPLETLCTMHAGDVVNLSAARIETFYAEDWAFAQFLARDPRYAPRFKIMMHDLSTGAAARFSSLPPDAPKDAWDPQSVKPMLAFYMNADLATLSGDYNAFIHEIVANHAPHGAME